MTLHKFCTDAGNGRLGEQWADVTEIVRIIPGRYGNPGEFIMRDGSRIAAYDDPARIAALANEARAALTIEDR